MVDQMNAIRIQIRYKVISIICTNINDTGAVVKVRSLAQSAMAFVCQYQLVGVEWKTFTEFVS
jgi:hypothetical protein